MSLIVLFFPFEKAKAAEEVPLTLNKLVTIIQKNGKPYLTPTRTPTDNNKSTAVSLSDGANFTINLDYASNITALYMDVLTGISDFKVEFYANENAVDLISSFIPKGNRIKSPIDVKNVKSVKVIGLSSYGNNLNDVVFYGHTVPVEHVEISNLTNSPTVDSVQLNWTNPKNSSFTGVNIYKNDTFIKSVDHPINTFTDNEVQEGKTYSYKVTSKFPDGHETPGILTNAVVPKTPVLRITDLTHNENHSRVIFEWKNPIDSTFKWIKIYRNDQIIAGSITENTFTDDKEIKPNTTYNYRFEIVNNKGRIFPGEELTVNVPAAPPAPQPVIGGGGFEEQPNGDYTATWETPVTGEIRVYVGGNLFRTVPASSQSITIPAADMVYTFIGDPDVRLQPVSEDGTEGETESPPPSVDTPFSVEDLIGSGSSLFLYVAPFLLLSLSFLLVPKLRNMIFSSLRKKKEKKANVNSERRTENDENKESVNSLAVKEKEERKVKRERKEQDKGKEHLAKIEKIESKAMQQQEKKAKRKREPREARIRKEKQIRYPKEAKRKREPRERVRNVREGRKEREPRNRKER